METVHVDYKAEGLKHYIPTSHDVMKVNEGYNLHNQRLQISLIYARNKNPRMI